MNFNIEQSTICFGFPETLYLIQTKNAIVMELANTLNIELLTYPPNLNLIERLWKFVKKKCLYSKYYDNFELFKQAINNCLALTLLTNMNLILYLLSSFNPFLKLKFLRFEV